MSNTIKEFQYFQHLCDFFTLSHLATFARILTWFREEGYKQIHLHLLQRMGFQPGLLAVIDSTALRSSLYDSQAFCEKSTHLHMFMGYKLHLYASVKGVVLSHAFVPTNRHGSAIAPSLLRSFEKLGLDVTCALRDVIYDSREIRKTAESLGIQMITAINKRNEIERLFHTLKDKGLECFCMFGYNRYRFHVQLVLFMHNIRYLL